MTPERLSTISGPLPTRLWRRSPVSRTLPVLKKNTLALVVSIVSDWGSHPLPVDGPRLAQPAAGAGFSLHWGRPGQAGASVPSTSVSGLRATPGDHNVDQRGEVPRRVEVTIDDQPAGLAGKHPFR